MDTLKIASQLAYDGKMIAADGFSEKRLVDEVGEWRPDQSIKIASWLRETLDPNQAVTFLSTSRKRDLETKMESGYTNESEIRLIQVRFWNEKFRFMFEPIQHF